MSRVTNIILTTTVTENEEPIEEINKILVEKGYTGYLTKVDQYVNSTKRMECGVYIAAINHIDFSNFMEIVGSVTWEDAENVQVYVQEQEDERFYKYNVV